MSRRRRPTFRLHKIKWLKYRSQRLRLTRRSSNKLIITRTSLATHLFAETPKLPTTSVQSLSHPKFCFRSASWTSHWTKLPRPWTRKHAGPSRRFSPSRTTAHPSPQCALSLNLFRNRTSSVKITCASRSFNHASETFRKRNLIVGHP